MVLPVDLPQAFLQYVGIDLGGGDVGVTQHHLHCPKVSSPLQQVGCKGMAYCMGFERGPDSRQFAVAPEHLPEPLTSHPLPSAGQKDHGRTLPLEQTLPSMVPVLLQRLPGGVAQRNGPDLSALSLTVQIPHVEIQVPDLQRHQLRNPQTRRIEHFQHGLVPEPHGPGCGRFSGSQVRLGQQRLHLIQ